MAHKEAPALRGKGNSKMRARLEAAGSQPAGVRSAQKKKTQKVTHQQGKQKLDKVAAPQSMTKTKRGGRIDLDRVCAWCCDTPAANLDGLSAAIDAACLGLGVTATSVWKAHKKHKHAENLTLNIRGVLSFVNNATAEDADALGSLKATVDERMAAAKYVPLHRRPPVEE